MSNRKTTKPLKRTRGGKIAARAQRNKQPIVRSSKNVPRLAVAAGSTETLLPDEPKQEASIVENRVAAPNDSSKMMRNEGFEFSLATANIRAYQVKLLEMAQVNMQFAFEFGQRLAMVRSPFEFSAVIAEFTNRRIDLFRKYSIELSVYPFWSIEASRKHTALPER
jgi:hypothetical protein